MNAQENFSKAQTAKTQASAKLNKAVSHLNTDPDQALSAFLESLEVEKNLSRLTIRNYKHYLNRFNNWLKEQGATDLTQLDQLTDTQTSREEHFQNRPVAQTGFTV